jgi:hypothetical protein
VTAARTLAAGLGAALALVAVAACGGNGENPAPTGAEYAALGDSDASGAGIAPVVDTDCQRSRANYASLVAKRMRYTSFKDVSCAAAETINLLRPQLTQVASNAPQLDALGSRTKLVTISIGLNDDKLAFGLLSACQPQDGNTSELCRQLIALPQSTVDKQFAEAGDRVEEALKLIKKDAPKARVVLVGYPRYFPDSGSCPDRIPMADDWLPRAAAAFATVNRDWKRAAAAAGADYVDTYALSKGHDVCADDPWVNGHEEVPGEAAALHPFAAYHRAVADAIVRLLKK